MLDFFANDEKPLRPFKRDPFYFKPNKLKFLAEISFSTHPTVVRKQKCHYKLYLALITWCDKYFKGEWDRPLCHALYTFHRCHLVTQPPSVETQYINNDLCVLRERIHKTFNMMPAMFPQRKDKAISMNEFYDFVEYSTDPEIIKIRKALRKLVGEEEAQEYKKLAFLDPRGLGYSFHPDEWFQRIENWLDAVTQKDPTVLEYIEKDPSNMGIRQTQVDLTIQFLCSRIIQESMTEEVLVFCKQVFSPAPTSNDF